MRIFFVMLCFLTSMPSISADEKCCSCCSCSDGLHNDCHCDRDHRCHPLCRCGRDSQTELTKRNFGVSSDKIAKNEVYSVNGRIITQPAGQPIPDDSGKLHLTIIGNEAERRRVLLDLATAPELAEFRDRFLVQDYPPDHWAVSLCGFYTAGHPTIYLQQPSGKVLHRQDDYDGPRRLAEALRKASNTYDANRDPDLRVAALDLSHIPTPAYILVAGFLLPLLFKKG
jgi:hypothetical protein